MQIPEKVVLDNNKSAKDNSDFVTEEIQKLLQKKCVTEVDYIPHVVNPLTVTKNKEKCRLVLDARHINPHLFKFRYKYEDASTARVIFKKGDFCFSYDLKSAYHHIEIFLADRTYLGFKWKNKYYVLNVLPFGLATSGYIFSKVVREMVKYWRSKGMKLIMYLDDGLGGGDNFDEALIASQVVRSDLDRFGFVIAQEKCNWTPVQRFIWLGFEWDMAESRIRLTENRGIKLKASIVWLLNHIENVSEKLVQVRFLASIVGQIISSQVDFKEEARLRTRFTYECILGRASWNARVLVSKEAHNEMVFWLENVNQLNVKGSDLCHLTNTKVQDLDIYCDASDVGYGGHLTFAHGRESVDSSENDFDLESGNMFGSWSLVGRSESSTWRELEAVNRMLKNSAQSIQGKCVKIFSDNKNVAHILNAGSRKVHLQELVMEVHDTCNANAINMLTQWVPRENNMKADALSRFSDCDDWGIQTWVIKYLEQLWGILTFDRFASDYNKKCKKFNSTFGCKNTSGINAFKQSWKHENNLLVPPPSMIPHVIRKLQSEHCEGVLIVPEWRSSPFWSMLVAQESQFQNFVIDHKYLHGYNLIERGRGNNGVFGRKFLKFRLVALRLKF